MIKYYESNVFYIYCHVYVAFIRGIIEIERFESSVLIE